MPNTVQICGKEVGKIGFGMMQLTMPGNHLSEEAALEVLKRATDSGATLFNSATFYGDMHNVKLLGAFFMKYPDYKEKIVVVIKGGMKDMSPIFDIDYWREDILRAQEALGDKRIDIFSLARFTPDLSVRDQCEALITLRDEGLFDAIGCSDLKAETMQEVSKYFFPACLEIEVSLWSHDNQVQACIAHCTAQSIPILAYSPLGSGLLTSKYTSFEDVPKDSFYAQHYPRFQKDTFDNNLKFVRNLVEIAAKKAISISQLALAWVATLSEVIIPIPGTTNASRVEENNAAGRIVLTRQDQEEIRALLDSFEIKGERYPDFFLKDAMQ